MTGQEIVEMVFENLQEPKYEILGIATWGQSDPKNLLVLMEGTCEFNVYFHDCQVTAIGGDRIIDNCDWLNSIKEVEVLHPKEE